MADHAEDIQKHVRVYMAVFASLGALTLLTVAASYLHAATSVHIAVALLIAVVKGGLVALYFMHLVSEQRTIYWLLALVLGFFLVLMYIPNGWMATEVRVKPLWDKLPAAQMVAPGEHGGHGEGHGGEMGGHH
jgi:cytochrome c oxidase subunit 4